MIRRLDAPGIREIPDPVCGALRTAASRSSVKLQGERHTDETNTSDET